MKAGRHARVFKKKDDHWYRKDETYDLSLDLLAYLSERLSKASHGRTVAVYRAFLTVVVDRIKRAGVPVGAD